MYFSRYCVRHLTEKLEMRVIKAIRAYLKGKKFVAKLFLLKSRANKLYMKFTVLIIHVLPQYNAVRIYKMYKNNLIV